MAPHFDLAYARALFRTAPLGDILRAAVRRARRTSPPALPSPPAEEVCRVAADALARAPRLFTSEPLGESYRQLFPDGIARFALRADKILDGQVELFGRSFALGNAFSWLRDPANGVVFDGETPVEALDPAKLRGGDPKRVWELARAAHLVELGAASRLVRGLELPARREIERQIGSFLDENRCGRGVHYTSALEVSLRAIHWLAAVELAGGARAFPRPFVERLGGALWCDAHFLATHLEDRGVVPANHLLGDWVGLYVISLALTGTPEVAGASAAARAGVLREAARQVGSDGAHFEASTAYHRFALELLLVALLASRSARVTLEVGDVVHRMLAYSRGMLAPDGSEPGFGDSDDARLLPVVPRTPHDHGYLLSIGVALFGDPALAPRGATFSEEALWLFGPEAHRTWQWVPKGPELPSVSYATGGVHVLRSNDLYVAMRSGSYGQRGVGGHAHNDQLALVVHARGKPLIVDAGTGGYTGDALLRDRFRGTAAHATVIVGGAEQSPILDGRPFALLDRARAPRVRLEELGASASLSGEHHGYERLPARVVHRRTLLLHRRERVLIIEDELRGRGEAPVEVRFPLAGEARLGVSDAARLRLDELRGFLGSVDLERAVLLDGALLVPLGAATLEAHVETAAFSPRYGTTERRPLVSFRGLLRIPALVKHALIFLGLGS